MPFLRKLAPCLIFMEACGTSHQWARELTALGHTVRLMPPAYVKPYVKRGKTDAADVRPRTRPHGLRLRRPLQSVQQPCYPTIRDCGLGRDGIELKAG